MVQVERAEQCAFKDEGHWIKDFDLAIDEARQDMLDARAAADRAPANADSVISTNVVSDFEDAVVVGLSSPKYERLMLPDDSGSAVYGPLNHPLQSRYTPRKTASALRSSMPQMS